MKSKIQFPKIICWMVFLTSLFIAFEGCTNLPSDSETANQEKVPDGGEPTQASETHERFFNFRMIAGVSMGGGMASMMGFRNHKKFDILGIMGGPSENNYLMNYIKDLTLQGFCSLEQLEKSKQAGTLNDKSSFCANEKPAPRFPFELTAHFNDWVYDDAGGNWNRSKMIGVFSDLFLAFGNPFYYNAKSTFWPHEQVPLNHRSSKNRCANPIRIKGIKHWKYNPDGKYDLITFCDGNNERSGTFYPKQTKYHRYPVETLLALDMNNNGKRDYGEPVVLFAHERYDDVGIDGCKNEREDGKGGCLAEGQKNPDASSDPNGDDYDPMKNPNGTQGNIRYDDGEPYKDFGIDGIAGTKDFGEDDKKFTMTPNYQNVLDHDPGTIVRKKMTKKDLDRLSIYLDAGVRDLFNFQVSALMLTGAIKAHYTNPNAVRKYDRFISLMPPGSDSFSSIRVNWHNKGQHVYIRYGKPNPTQKDLDSGDGDHIHGVKLLARLQNFFYFASSHFPEPDLTPTPIDYSTNESETQHFVYDSKVLGGKYIYSVVLPPGFNKHKDKKYPILYFGHGYGMDGPYLASLFKIFVGDMAAGAVAKMILVSIHGKCSSYIPNDKSKDPGDWKTKPFKYCKTGTFYVDGRGLNNDGPKMEKALFEVIDRVEKQYKDRLRKPGTFQVKRRYPKN